MYLKNRLFKTQSDSEASKKLDMVLRQLSGNLLTDDQRVRIEQLLESERQYLIRLCRSRQVFDGMLQIEPNTSPVYPLVDKDSQNEIPLAAIIRNPCGEVESSMLCIYIPSEEGQQDEPRDKETQTA